jgi:hypothetical protein
MMATMGRWLVLCTLSNIRSMDFLTCICSSSWRSKTRLGLWSRWMPSFLLSFLIPIFTHNFTLLSQSTYSMALALHKGALNILCAKKHFPKAFAPQTIIKEDGYPDYAHPDNGRTV